MKTRFILLWICVSVVNLCKAQEYISLSQRVETTKIKTSALVLQAFKKISSQKALSHKNTIDTEDFYVLDEKLINTFYDPAIELISIPLVYHKEEIILELIPYQLHSNDYFLEMSSGEIITTNHKKRFFHGVLKGEDNSTTSLSIINGEVKISISRINQNIEISKHQDVYAAFNSAARKGQKDFVCSYLDPHNELIKQGGSNNQGAQIGGCVDVYIEVDFEGYKDHSNSTQNVETWVEQIINEVALIYNNEGIPIKLSQIKVWNTEDPYRAFSDLSSILVEFGKTLQNNYNGRLAHLMSTRNIPGGIAWLDVLCSDYSSNGHWGPYGVTGGLSTFVVPFPSYSWNVNSIAHELGHNFGSSHTHDCVWGSNNNQQIDDCGSHYTGIFPKPLCYNSSAPILPFDGGTIMSYCQLGATGVNFSKAFGPEPGDLLRQRFNNSFCTTGEDCNASNELPLIVCPSNFNGINNCNTQDLDPNLTGQATASGGVGILAIEYTDEYTNNSECALSITRQWKVIDGIGQTNDCDQRITLSDIIKPVILNCPQNISLNAVDGSCSAPAFWPEILANDQCDNDVQIISSHNSGDNFPIGQSVVEILVEDNCSNMANCSFMVTVVDELKPSISNCPDDLFFNTDNQCSRFVSWSAPEANDNCGISSLSSNYNSGENFDVGTTEIVYIATDLNGNTQSCSFNIIIQDNIDPIFVNCPLDINLAANDNCEARALWAIPQISDNCTILSMTSNYNSGDIFPIGVSEIIYNLSDVSGNANSCSFNIIVSGNTIARFNNCPDDITMSASDDCATVVNWFAPELIGNCKPYTIRSNVNPGAAFPVGTSTVVYTAEAINGSQISCSFKVVIVDNTIPLLLNCPSDISVVSNANCLAVISWVNPSTADNCFGVNLEANYVSGSTFDVGITEVVITATDQNSNTSSCSFNVEVLDFCHSDLSLNCPNDFYSDLDCPIMDLTTEVTGMASYTGGIGLVNLDYEDEVVSNSNCLRIINRTWTAIDIQNNNVSCEQIIEYFDAIAPILDKLEDHHYSCAEGISFSNPEATDNCGAVSLEYVEESIDGPQGMIYTRLWTATDACQNSSQVQQSFFPIQDLAPVFSSTIENGTYECGTIPQFETPTVSDDCGSVVLEYTDNILDDGCLGESILRTWLATDEEGNTGTAVQLMQVNDTQAPVFNYCPLDQILALDDSCEIAVYWEEAFAEDLCSGVNITSNKLSGDSFEVGIHSIEITATDACGNSSVCSFSIEVIDEYSPLVISCPSDTIVYSDNDCMAVVNWNAPIFQDNCDHNISANVSNGSDFIVGLHQIIYTATDLSGNIASCSFEINVIDRCSQNVAILCPDDYYAPYYCHEDDSNPTVTGMASTAGTSNEIELNYVNQILFQDDCGIEIKRTWIARDKVENDSAECFQLIMLIDNIAPQITNCLDDLFINVSDTCDVQVYWNEIATEDNCELVVAVESSHDSGERFNIGENEVMVTAMDACGNVSICNFIVNVMDDLPPVFENCPQNITVVSDNNCRALVSWELPSITDECDYQLKSNFFNNQMFQVGYSTVIYTATDEAGNSSSCFFLIEVLDACSNSFEMTMPSDYYSNELCDTLVDSLEITGSPSFKNATGEVRVTYLDSLVIDTLCTKKIARVWEAWDGADNYLTATQYLEISDTKGPEFISIPANILLYVDEQCKAVAEWDMPLVKDECGEEISIYYSHMPGMHFRLGNTRVEIKAIDACGNVSVAYFFIRVEYPEHPFFIACPPNQFIEVDNTSPIPVYWDDPVIYGACTENIKVNVSHPQGSWFGKGITTVVYDATDKRGNTEYCYFSIEIKVKDASRCQDSLMISHDKVLSGLYESNSVLFSNSSIDLDSIVQYQAGNEIDLMPGFEVTKGADFEIKIGECDNK